MAEWLKAHAWKACVPQGTVGSNPTLSATLYYSTSFNCVESFQEAHTVINNFVECSASGPAFEQWEIEEQALHRRIARK
jgi:hypothetical protein